MMPPPNITGSHVQRLLALPLTGRRISIFADEEHGDLEFGTGWVKISPGGISRCLLTRRLSMSG